jgi:hypothetical protein
MTTIMAAPSCRSNDILRRRDNLVTGCRQIAPANGSREFHMVAKHFPLKANDFLRRNDFPDDAWGSAEKQTMRAARVDLTVVSSPNVVTAVSDKYSAALVARSDTNQRKVTFWFSVLDYLIKSFALYGAAMHPTPLFAVEFDRAEEHTPQPRDAHAASAELRSNHVTPAGYVIAFSDDSSRERERKITTTIAALAELDDRTLLDMGIPHRSQIELVVRYCYDC